MKIENPEYRLNQGYPLLDVVLDGVAYNIDPEQKPTLVRHGLTAVSESSYTADLLGQTLTGVSDDPRIFRLVTAFGLNVYHRRFTEGPASDQIDPAELTELGERLEPYAGPKSPSWGDVGPASPDG